MPTAAAPKSDEQLLHESIIDEEGSSETPYQDTKGLWTIGHGLCLERSPLTSAQWRTLLDAGEIEVRLRPSGARRLMAERLVTIDRGLRLLLPWYEQLDSVRQRVLIHMAYQMGLQFVREFPRFIAAVERADWSGARVHGLDSKWAREDTPARAHRLMLQLERGY